MGKAKRSQVERGIPVWVYIAALGVAVVIGLMILNQRSLEAQRAEEAKAAVAAQAKAAADRQAAEAAAAVNAAAEQRAQLEPLWALARERGSLKDWDGAAAAINQARAIGHDDAETMALIDTLGADYVKLSLPPNTSAARLPFVTSDIWNGWDQRFGLKRDHLPKDLH